MIATFQSGATIASGKAFKDAEIEYVGKNNTPCCRFAIIVGKEAGEEGKAVFLNCKAWHALAKLASAICKGDSIAVMGTMSHYTSPKNGVTYKTLDVEWIDVKSKDFVKAAQPPMHDESDGYALDTEEEYSEEEERADAGPDDAGEIKLPWE